MIRIFKYLNKKEIMFLSICIAFLVFQVYVDLKLPEYMSEVTKLVQIEGSLVKDIVIAGGKMLLCAFGSFVASIIIGFFSSQAASGFSRRIRMFVYNKTLDFSVEEINKFSTPSLITRTTNDIQQIQTFIAMGLHIVIKAPIMAIWAITKITTKHIEFSYATAVAVSFILTVMIIMITMVMPKSRAIQKLIDNLNMVAREKLTGLRVIRAFNAEHYQENKFDEANDTLTKTQLFVNRSMAVVNPTMTFVTTTLTLSIYWIGAYIINEANMLHRIDIFSDMVVFTSYAMQIIFAFMMLAMIVVVLPRTAVSINRILEVLDCSTKIKDGNLTEKETSKDSNNIIEFKNVNFAYADASEKVLENVSFVVEKGETVAFIGSTGSGKSTLVNLIPRFYDVSSGEILLNGINIKKYTQKTLRNKLGYVSQKAVLFSGTIKENIVFNNEEKENIDLNRLENAIEISQAKEFVDDIGYDSEVSQGGTNLSGGQKQRVSIARAIYKKPEIFIFDDSFSALDYKTDKSLRYALNEKIKNSTKLIVAQRIATIKDANKIIVLDEGKIVGEGTHKELLKTCKCYKEIALSQLSKEELENEQ